MKYFFIIPIRFYKILLSPILSVFVGRSCRYSPTCSVYAQQAIEKYGLKGVILAFRRILRCNWRATKYYDPLT